MVTGVRLLKVNRIIHLFIKERTLREKGKVDDELKEWAGDYKYVVDDLGLDSDYFTLSWDDRTLELGTIYVPVGSVVTGVRFRYVNGRLRFEVRSTPYDHERGLLSQERSRTFWNGRSDESKRRIPLENLDVPTRATSHSARLKESNYFIEFTHTDIYKDAAQTTGEPLGRADTRNSKLIRFFRPSSVHRHAARRSQPAEAADGRRHLLQVLSGVRRLYRALNLPRSDP